MIYSITFGDHDTASSRLRVFNIIPHIKDYVYGVPEEYKDGDVLVIQKVPNMEELKRAKSQGAKVVYDIDDRYDSEQFLEMIREADIVTTDTDEKKKWLISYNDNVEVIPDSLDWDGTKKETYEYKGIIGWTGYGNNAAYLTGLVIPEGFTLRMISSDWFRHYDNLKAQSRPWSLAMVDKYLSECDLGVYYLPEGDFERCKGMHKLLKNWAIGLPTYTTAMPDYVKAMEEAGVGSQYLIKTGEEIKDVPFDERLREYALRYSSENVAKLWEKILS